MNNFKMIFNLVVLLYMLLILLKNNIKIDFNLIFGSIHISLWLIIFISFAAGSLFVMFNNIKVKKKKKVVADSKDINETK